MDIFNGNRLRAYVANVSSSQLAVTFDYWRRDKRCFPDRRRASSFSKRGYAHLRVETSRNDWFINEELPLLLGAVSDFAKTYRSIAGVATSMGAYGALIASLEVNFDRLILISPNATVSGLRVPDDLRFKKDMEIGAFETTVDDLVYSRMRDHTRCSIIFDSEVSWDKQHATLASHLFSDPEIIDLPGTGHPATNGIFRDGDFGRLIDSLFCREEFGSLFAEFVNPRRHCPAAWPKVSATLIPA